MGKGGEEVGSTYRWEIQLCGRRCRRDLGGVGGGSAGKGGAAGCRMGRSRWRSSVLPGYEMVERPATSAAPVRAAAAWEVRAAAARSRRQEGETRVGASVSDPLQPAVYRRVSGGSIGPRHVKPGLPNAPEVFSSGLKMGWVRHAKTQKYTPAEQGLSVFCLLYMLHIKS
jgi:hypothetical protein